MSTRLQRFRTMAVTLFALALTVLNLLREETFAMADPLVQLGWEWRAERPLEQRVGLRLVKIEKEGGGLFGLGRPRHLAVLYLMRNACRLMSWRSITRGRR